ncbi:DNA-binding transcriptional regulator, FrmR family [Desulfosporosinus hippei DSM 8344]|uniref:DNA-binding transcriptional regulator, FrmR family n=2 Tax=Desulfosporosinus TaxID=79206 RepID=A0A1G8GFI8_9FIRM|nr:DNA-binding transcriptional regulator, FrmR family [Desulfosporosinus hippei DSM 8344]
MKNVLKLLTFMVKEELTRKEALAIILIVATPLGYRRMHSMTNSTPYSESKDDIVRRLKKIEGQVKGIQRMVESDKYCVDVLIQVAAVRAALNRVGTIVFEHHSRGCMRNAVENNNQEAAIEELIGVLAKFIK